MSNKKIGNGFETEFCEKLFQNGYWVHNIAQNAAGQPADVIAVRNGVAFLIDCYQRNASSRLVHHLYAPLPVYDCTRYLRERQH